MTRPDELVARMVSDTGNGQALPLLAYTLQRLYSEAREAGTTVLSATLYDKTGGVRGALVDHADAALAEATAATGSTDEEVLTALLRLITVDADGRPTRRQVPLDHLSDSTGREVTPFVARRLLTVNNSNGQTVVDIAHEHIFTAWTPLATAIGQAADGLRLRAAVEDTAADWNRHGRPTNYLWEFDRATETRRAVNLTELTPIARIFLDISRRHGQRRRRRLTAALTSALLLVTSGAFIALVQWHIAVDRGKATERERRTAVAQRLITEATALPSSTPRRALKLDLAAHEIDGRVGAMDQIATILTDNTLQASLTDHLDAVSGVALTPDGRTALTGSRDGTAIVWDLSDPAHPAHRATLTGHADVVNAVALTPDGRTALTGSRDGTAIVWDLSDPAHPVRRATLSGHDDTIFAVALTPDGRTALTGSADHTAIVWDLSDPAHPVHRTTLTGHDDTIFAVALTSDGRTALTGSADHTAIVWDLSNPAHPVHRTTLTGHTDKVNAAALTSDGRTALTASDDRTAIVWDLSNPARPVRRATLTGHTDKVWAAALTPDGRTALTGGSDNTAIVWDLSDPARPVRRATLSGHTTIVGQVSVTPDGRTALTASADHTAILWDLTRTHTLALHDSTVYAAALTPDGRTALTGSWDRTAIVWDLSDPARPVRRATLTGEELSRPVDGDR